MFGDLAHPHGTASLDENSQKPPAVREITDLLGRLLVDAGIDEANEETIITHHPDGGISGADQFSGEVGYALKKRVDIKLRGERQTGLDEPRGLSATEIIHPPESKRWARERSRGHF